MPAIGFLFWMLKASNRLFIQQVIGCYRLLNHKATNSRFLISLRRSICHRTVPASLQVARPQKNCGVALMSINQSLFFVIRMVGSALKQILENTCHDSNFAMEKPIRGSMVGGLLWDCSTIGVPCGLTMVEMQFFHKSTKRVHSYFKVHNLRTSKHRFGIWNNCEHSIKCGWTSFPSSGFYFFVKCLFSCHTLLESVSPSLVPWERNAEIDCGATWLG